VTTIDGVARVGCYNASMTTDIQASVVELTDDTFDERIRGQSLAIVDFWAPWCAPCRAFAPTFAAAARKHPDILFAKVNTEDEQQLAAQFNIRSIPTLMVFRDDIIVFMQAGALPASALEQVIAASRALDMDDVRRKIAEQQAKPTADNAAG
jgi:thioredoxin